MAEDRCPECGKPFDRTRLLRELTWGPKPLPIWDEPHRPVLGRLLHMYAMTFFRPGRLARKAPRFLSSRSLARFRLIALTVAAVTYVMLLGVTPARDKTLLAIGGIIGGWIGIVVCETLLSLFFIAMLVAPDAGKLPPLEPGTSERAWGMVGVFRTFAVLGVVGLLLPEVLGYGRASGTNTWLLIATWWWAALAAAVWVQPARVAGRVTAILAVPFIEAGSAIAGLIFALAVGIVLQGAGL